MFQNLLGFYIGSVLTECKKKQKDMLFLFSPNIIFDWIINIAPGFGGLWKQGNAKDRRKEIMWSLDNVSKLA